MKLALATLAIVAAVLNEVVAAAFTLSQSSVNTAKRAIEANRFTHVGKENQESASIHVLQRRAGPLGIFENVRNMSHDSRVHPMPVTSESAGRALDQQPEPASQAAMGCSNAKSLNEQLASQTNPRGRKRPHADETFEHREMRLAWESAEREMSKFQNAGMHDDVQLARLRRKLWTSGLAYYNFKWPEVPWSKVEMTLDQARKEFKALRKRVYDSKKPKARMPKEELEQLLKLHDEAERRYMAARIDPANEEAHADMRHHASSMARLSEQRRGKRKSKAALTQDASNNSKAPMLSDSFAPQAYPDSAAQREQEAENVPPFHGSSTPPGSPELQALLADPTSADLNW